MIGIIKYQAGNLTSVSNALKRLGADHFISDEPDELSKADGIIFPGVGHAGAAMDDLRSRDLDVWLKNTDKPVLGICLGMQLLYESSEEGDSETLGLIPGRLKKFDSSKAKVPHMGWNQFAPQKEHPLINGIGNQQFLYYVHGYYAPSNDHALATCKYINDFAAVVAKDNFMGVQFHPEKSGSVGSLLLQNFLDMVKSNGS
ncbi:imidazole glycerol phosphate synthase subunit HisH [Rhodohalobacter sp. SW132]|uniref:imidazole glycerol phosphate synthase subunit HisH n=1 Tax=Rhodohalobacter sp. SW132 TaxID=2293433 RepID=UPI000E24879A|nr:imidazole glycerol phosphate synthase subunit HisH [Rhodohalobacter sp. SW132]REL32862.1 imidazole glycerol phosphate synthase subunit HisH [Rhodohalobacter sp. SW132]